MNGLFQENEEEEIQVSPQDLKYMKAEGLFKVDIFMAKQNSNHSHELLPGNKA